MQWQHSLSLLLNFSFWFVVSSERFAALDPFRQDRWDPWGISLMQPLFLFLPLHLSLALHLRRCRWVSFFLSLSLSLFHSLSPYQNDFTFYISTPIFMTQQMDVGCDWIVRQVRHSPIGTGHIRAREHVERYIGETVNICNTVHWEVEKVLVK